MTDYLPPELQDGHTSHEFLKPEPKPKTVKIVGVGGAGNRAVENMVNKVDNAQFVIINTDAQTLSKTNVGSKLQIGADGQGAGSNPAVALAAANDNREDIQKLFGPELDMVFVTAGMGGGTGTGAAPLIAEIARSSGKLTVAIVTLPLRSEGKRKMARALEGLRAMRESCDSLLVILNDDLVNEYGHHSYLEAFNMADNILLYAARNIADVLTKKSHPNLDFSDISAAMRASSTALMGSAEVSLDVEEPYIQALNDALDSTLLKNKNIDGAQWVLLGFFFKENEPTMAVVNQMVRLLEEYAGDHVEIKFGGFKEESLEGKIRVTVIATGFEEEDPYFGYGDVLEPSKKKPSSHSGKSHSEAPKPNIAYDNANVVMHVAAGATSYDLFGGTVRESITDTLEEVIAQPHGLTKESQRFEKERMIQLEMAKAKGFAGFQDPAVRQYFETPPLLRGEGTYIPSYTGGGEIGRTSVSRDGRLGNTNQLITDTPD